MSWYGYKNFNHHFEYTGVSQLNLFFNEGTQDLPIVDGKNKLQYYNIPSAFDIEVSSYTMGVDKKGKPLKHACMYVWQFGMNGSTIIGRTWEQFEELIRELQKRLKLNRFLKILIYVHNLGYEFQFIRKHFPWEKVFSIKNRRPVYASFGGIEFRCSYFLSNYALAYIGENMLKKYPVKKMVGDLDYSLIRHSYTPLTDKEKEYCLNDVRVVMAYIQEKIENEGGIQNIPLTNTGYVRRYCKEECFYQGIPENDLEGRKRVQMNYRALMKSLQINELAEYEQLKRVFGGGFTHASSLYSGQTLYDLGHADLTSSYPYCMCGQYFPMTRFQYIGKVEDLKVFKHLLKTYCCVFDVQFTNLRPKELQENYLSESKCKIKGKKVINNGRIVSADTVITTLTELDYDTTAKFYDWDTMKVINMRTSKRGYLPKPLVLAILNMYKDKTSLKGIEDKETEYLVSKNMINASFGMMVTAIIRDECSYDNEEGWLKTSADVASQLNKYNNGFNRFLYYAWGVWVTAHARHNLFSAIYEFGTDYVYSDTDSIFGLNFEVHQDYFIKYNRQVKLNLLNMCNHYHIPFSMCQPETIKGEKKVLGVWDFEDDCLMFKTLGAKRYLLKNARNNKVELTVSGLNKHIALPYMIEEAKKRCKENNLDVDKYWETILFENFRDGMYIPAGKTGKMTMTYIDDGCEGVVEDYMGVKAEYHELSCTHAENQSYRMSITGDYQRFLEGVQYIEF